MRGVKAAVSLSAIVLVLFLGIAYMSFGVLRIDPWQKYTTATMLLTDSGGLAPKTPVLLAGVEVGEVTSISKVASGVEVTFRIDDKFEVPTSSSVRVENLSALGEPYIEFEPPDGDGPYLADGDVVETSTIEQPVSIPQVSTRVVELLEQFDPKAVSSIVGTFAQGLDGTEAVVPTLERSTALLASTILSRTSSIEQLLLDAQAIGADMAWLGPALTESGPKWAGFGQLVDDIINEAVPLVEVPGSPELYETGDGLVPFLTQLTAFLNKVGPGIAELAPVVQPFAADLARTAPQFDISALITQALTTVGDDGALQLNITVN